MTFGRHFLLALGPIALVVHMALGSAPFANGWGAFKPFGGVLLLLSTVGYLAILARSALPLIAAARAGRWLELGALGVLTLAAMCAAGVSTLTQLTSVHDQGTTITMAFVASASAWAGAAWADRRHRRHLPESV